MPDYPPASIDIAAVAAGVWGYATRVLTAGTNIVLPSQAFPFTDPGAPVDLLNLQVGISPTAAGRAGNLDYLDASVAGVAAAVWVVASRELTAITGTPRTDLLGEDATFEAGTGARKVKIDALLGTVADIEGAQTATGGEDILVSTSDNKAHYVEGGIDLTNMVAGNVTTIRYYLKLKSGGAFVKYAEQVYSDVQTLPGLHITSKTSKYGVKVTLQQAAVTYKIYDYDFQKLVRA